MSLLFCQSAYLSREHFGDSLFIFEKVNSGAKYKLYCRRVF